MSRSPLSFSARPSRRVPLLTAVCCGILLTATQSLRANDWPTFRHDSSRSGATTESLKVPLKQSWVYSAPAAPKTAWSGPAGRNFEGHMVIDRVKYDDALFVAVVGHRIYFGSSVDHSVSCRDTASGKVLWSFVTGGPVRLAPTVANNRIYFGSDDGYAYCLDAKTGRIIWKRRAGPDEDRLIARGEIISRWPVRTSISVTDGVAYFGAGIFPHEDIFLYAVDAKDGSIVWKRDNISESEAGRNELSPQGYWLTAAGQLVIPSGRSWPSVFDTKTGKRLFKVRASWRGAGGGPVGGTKALLADGQIYAIGLDHFVAADLKKGRVSHGIVDGRQLSIVGKAAYVATGARVQKLDLPNYLVASRRRLKLKLQLRDLYRKVRGTKGQKKTDMAKQIDAIRAEGAELLKKGIAWQVSSDQDSSLIVAGNHIFVGGKKGVTAYETQSGRKVWSAAVDGEATGLAVADSRLFVSTTTGKIYSFDSAEAKSTSPVSASPLVKNPYPKDNLSAMYETAAKGILKQSGVERGFCLVVGSELGRLAYEIAQRSGLKVYGIEPNADKVATSRRLLATTGLYGHRIVILQADPSDIPFSDYFANLIVSDSLLLTGQVPGDPLRIARHLKPLGGMICLGAPAGAPRAPQTKAVRSWLAKTRLAGSGSVRSAGPWTILTRGKLAGAANWTHQYGDAGNTASSDDRRVKGGLGVLWYGDPGPGKMVNRHDGAVGPLSVDGRLFIQGENSVMAFDAYNGLKLWERANPKALRTGVFMGRNPGNLVAGPNSLFVMIGETVEELDAATGRLKAEHRIPKELDRKTHQWGYVAFGNGLLFGTATVRKSLTRRLRRRGRKTLDATDALFAIDTRTGKTRWTYRGGSIAFQTVAIGPQRVFFIDSTITSDQRAELLRRDKTELKKLTGRAREIAEDRMKKLDARLAVALDAKTGRKLWSKPVDVTDCSDIGIGGGGLTLMYHNNVLVLCGANANGHYWRQFMAGEFSRRRLLSLSADDGHRLWVKDGNYRHRPIIVEDQIIAEPWSYDLYTGAQRMRAHPLTGKQVPWSFIRPGHHCGMITGSPNMLMFRSLSAGFYNLDTDSGTRHFAGQRLGCWINAIPANGLVMIPEASAGCVCLFSIASTVTLQPRKAKHPWTIYSAVGPQLPVAHMALNFGAPGDRKDARGRLWLAYPRPNPRKVTGLDLKISLKEKFLPGGGFATQSARSISITGNETEWLFTSSANGLSECAVPLLGKNDKPTVYTVKLYFAELRPNAKIGDRVFDVTMQGKTVLKDFDVAAAAKGPRRAVVRTIQNISVTGNLKIRLLSKVNRPAVDNAPVLSAIEIVRAGSR